ncbi:MAG: CAAX protease [Candidatus Nitrosotenuis sp.]|nr:MAG: CAAX protease [Candidatus Nitrosotenuis sp.]
MQGGTALVAEIIPDYEPPSFPVSLSLAMASGPFEEGLFFGIPYYLGGIMYSVLVGGTIWSFAHVFSTQTLALNGLAYATFLATIPHLFFSLRTWISGKGWFAIVFHSSWNVAFVASYCSTGILSCSIISPGDQLITDILAVASACAVALIVYSLYKKNRISAQRFRLVMILSVSVFAIAQATMTAKYVQLFFFKI